MGATSGCTDILLAISLSIHAPEWERHIVIEQAGVDTQLSIHAPEWERRMAIVSMGMIHGFQSTLPNGSDDGL